MELMEDKAAAAALDRAQLLKMALKRDEVTIQTHDNLVAYCLRRLCMNYVYMYVAQVCMHVNMQGLFYVPILCRPLYMYVLLYMYACICKTVSASMCM